MNAAAMSLSSHWRVAQRLLNATGSMARVGGWEHVLATGKAVWTQALYDIVGVPCGQEPPGMDEYRKAHPREKQNGDSDTILDTEAERQ